MLPGRADDRAFTRAVLAHLTPQERAALGRVTVAAEDDDEALAATERLTTLARRMVHRGRPKPRRRRKLSCGRRPGRGV